MFKFCAYLVFILFHESYFIFCPLFILVKSNQYLKRRHELNKQDFIETQNLSQELIRDRKIYFLTEQTFELQRYHFSRSKFKFLRGEKPSRNSMKNAILQIEETNHQILLNSRNVNLYLRPNV